MNDVTADTLMRQAPTTVDFYLKEAIASIDDRLGEGSAKKHPELLAAFIKASAMDFSYALISLQLENKLEEIAEAIAREKESDE